MDAKTFDITDMSGKALSGGMAYSGVVGVIADMLGIQMTIGYIGLLSVVFSLIGA